MPVYEVTPGIYKIFSKVASLKTYSTVYFSKQQNETGYFCEMTLVDFWSCYGKKKGPKTCFLLVP